MVLPVVGWTIGMANGFKSKHFGVEVGRGLDGVNMSGEFAHTHSVRKFMASWLIMLCLCMPPLIGTKRICGIQVCAVGVAVGWAQVPMQQVGAGVGGDGCTRTWCRSRLVMRGTNPGMLFCVCLVCDQGVSLCARFVVGLGAAMIAGALVTRMYGVGSNVVGKSSPTLCVTLCSVMGILATLWGSPAGRIHSCSGLVRMHWTFISWVAANFLWQEWGHVLFYRVHFFGSCNQFVNDFL
jgi:hypothetical protein